MWRSMKHILFLVFVCAAALTAADEDGAALFQKHCALCHKDPPVNRAPLPEALMKLTGEQIRQSMDSGSMKEQSAALNAEQKAAIAAHLSRAAAVKADAGRCAPGYEPRTDSSFWNGWGVDPENSRFQPAKMAGLTAADVPKLQLKWAFGIPNSPVAASQPTLFAGRLFFGSNDGTVYATDAKTGCILWTFKAAASVRTAIMIGVVSNANPAAMFGDTQANVYAVSTKTGNLVWKLKVDNHPVARITGAPKMYGSRLYVPVSSIEEVTGGSVKYECCKFRGSVVAIDVESGKQVWKSYTIPDPPQPTKKNSAGIQLYGPAGAAVWLSPTLDLQQRLVIVGTGNGYSDPANKYTDAVIAFDMDTGSMKWVRQLAENDGWNFACVSPNKANCPEKNGPDVDIGASPILRTLSGGKRVLVVGQKSGVVHGLDPDNEGKILWQTRIGQGGALGGVQWGMAADNNNAYVALSDIHLRAKAGGLFALNLATGAKVWFAAPPEPPCAGKNGCTPALMAPLTVIPGLVLAGSMDGVLRAHDAATGKIVWEFNTARDFDTINGVKAKGGSLSATGPVLANGMMFVNSGYGTLGGMPGNVLLAFGPQ
ncbi:MAG: PQQ-binding-like beta-propeller repeat protein [Acidobacteria bacterium]|nr:PQQ-binding-like beta-propeller repeat protein [Acidobacteriota bacterium]